MRDHGAIRQRFLALNRDRLTRIGETLRPRQREAVEALPFLFHVNDEALPGYVSPKTPVGISDYTPSRRVVEALGRRIRGLRYRRRALARYDIHALFLMGSSGTIAHTTESDFDVWVCHAPDLAAPALAELQLRAAGIERWAASLGLEVHVFLMNPEHFRNGRVVELSTESSGSTQHHLLLDEFYRTAVLLAGRYPAWWLVPPEEEARYDDHTRRLLRTGVVRVHETIDFGGLPRLPAEEFFGAALWHLYKSIDSPYKAALKLMLMEAYAAEYPEVGLLSLAFKRAVHGGPVTLTELDPYVMLYRKVETYLRTQADEGRLALMQRCLYFKVGLPFSRPGVARRTDWASEVMRGLIEEWGWTEADLRHLDARRRWKIDQVAAERASLVQALTRSYHALSRFGRVHGVLASINQNDLNILGRKLYAAFERKPGKVEIVNRGISDDVRESHLAIVQTSARDRGWLLFREAPGRDGAAPNRPLGRARSLVELLAWAQINGLLDDRTALSLQARDPGADMNTVRGILRALEPFAPEALRGPTRFEALDQPPALLETMLFINVGLLPDTALTREGRHLASDHSDALSYGGVCENRILSVHQLTLNSWGEVCALAHEGEVSILEALAAHLNLAPPRGSLPPPPRTYCFCAGQSMSVVRRIDELFRDVRRVFHTDHPHASATRYIVLVGSRYYGLSFENAQLVWQRFDSHAELLQYLGEPVDSFRPVVIDRHALAGDLLPLIFQHNRPGTVQLFGIEEAKAATLYILDERGSLYWHHAPGARLQPLVRRHRRFLEAVAARQTTQGGAPMERALRIEAYRGHRRTHGRNVLTALREVTGPEEAEVVPIRVTARVSAAGTPEIIIRAAERDFISSDHGEALYAVVAAHLWQHHPNAECLAADITDIALAPELVGARPGDRLQTIHYLSYRRRIGEGIDRALSRPDRGATAFGG